MNNKIKFYLVNMPENVKEYFLANATKPENTAFVQYTVHEEAGDLLSDWLVENGAGYTEEVLIKYSI